MGKERKLIFPDKVHPKYSSMQSNWSKWRLCYEAGDTFREEYLVKYDDRERPEAFRKRKKITPIPAFAAEGIIEIRDAMYQRASDIVRKGGTPSYIEACQGKNGGVDGLSSTMNSFIMNQVLDELLPMQTVGVLVDSPVTQGETLADTQGQHPFLQIFKVEDIRSHSDVNGELDTLLLRYNDYERDEFGLPSKVYQYFVLYTLRDGVVTITIEKPDSTETRPLNINKIPFVMVQIPKSLMENVADYQIALLNMESSDVSYALHSNFPFYIENYDPKVDLVNNRKNNSFEETEEGESSGINYDKDSAVIKAGNSQGRRYAKGLDAPNFINPSGEPLQVSMEKQGQIRKSIRQLVNLNLSSFVLTQSSAESKEADNEGLEGGLATLGMILESAEREIAKMWAMFESSQEVSTVNYPQRYSLKTTSQLLSEAKEKLDWASKINSPVIQKETAKETVILIYGTRVSRELLDIALQEIEKSDTPIIMAEEIMEHVKEGLVSHEYVSKEIFHYPQGQIEKAKEEHAERATRILEAQTNAAARGVDDLTNDNKSGITEKEENNG